MNPLPVIEHLYVIENGRPGSCHGVKYLATYQLVLQLPEEASATALRGDGTPTLSTPSTKAPQASPLAGC